MNKLKFSRLACIAAFLLVSVMTVHAQIGKNKVAVNLYERLGYKTSIPKFQEKKSTSLNDLQRIANSYRLNHDTKNAEFWYEQVVVNSPVATDFLYYAQALQNNGKYEKAKEYYLKYDDMIGGDSKDLRGQLLAQAIDRMNEFKHTNVIVKNESILNTDKLDFSPTYYNDGIIFVSSRGSQVNDRSIKDIWIDDNFMALFESSITDEGALNEPGLFSLNLTTKFHEGPVSFNRSGDRIFFTRNDYRKRRRRNNSKGIMKLEIYTSFKDGDDWSQPEALPFNTKEYEEAHPAVSPDGKLLFFTSDREGGYGGMDLYVSEFISGIWSVPMNLGEKVNTPGNEVFPYVHDDGTLYFASNGWGGLGGLDIFTTRITAEELWTQADNIGTPFNSEMDDFGLIMNVLGTEGYFTSARDNGLGKDDIYSFKRKGAGFMEAIICTYENESNARIDDVEVTVEERTSKDKVDDDFTLRLLETDGMDEYLLKFKRDAAESTEDKVVYHTNDAGEFKMSMRPDREYVFVAKKDGYTIATETLSTFGKKTMTFDFCIPLEAPKCLALEGIVKNKTYGNIISNADVTMVNMCTGEEIVVKSGKNGEFSFPCVDCDCDYKFKGEKTHFIPGLNKATTVGLECTKGGLVETEVLLELTPGDPFKAEPENPFVTPPPPAPTVVYNVAPPPPPIASMNYSNLTIELQNIYYDFDQFYIRNIDAQRDLDKVVSLMHRYPSMIIELGSHTDARGTNAYNQKLSQNRANAAVDYIVSKGVDRRRLVAKGYGESQLRNGCKNFAVCPELDHQYNRRTEIKIVSFNEPGVSVRYIDNKPEIVDPADPMRSWIWD